MNTNIDLRLNFISTPLELRLHHSFKDSRAIHFARQAMHDVGPVPMARRWMGKLVAGVLVKLHNDQVEGITYLGSIAMCIHRVRPEHPIIDEITDLAETVSDGKCYCEVYVRQLICRAVTLMVTVICHTPDLGNDYPPEHLEYVSSNVVDAWCRPWDELGIN